MKIVLDVCHPAPLDTEEKCEADRSFCRGPISAEKPHSFADWEADLLNRL
jgi:hypothetical protein